MIFVDFIASIAILFLITSSVALIIQDIKYKAVDIAWVAAFGIGSLLWFMLFHHASLAIFFILCVLGLIGKIFFGMVLLGGADYLIGLCISPFFYNSDLPGVLMLIGTFGIFTALLGKSKKHAFIPAILGGVWLLNLFKFFYLF